MTITTSELKALADHYAATMDERGTPCEVLRNMAGHYVAVFAPIGRVVPLGANRDNAYSTLAALQEVADHTTPHHTKGDTTS